MQILIGCAKDMTTTSAITPPLVTEPRFQKEANDNAMQLSRYDADQLQDLLCVSPKLAKEVHHRYQTFFNDDNHPLAAILSYHGVVFRTMGLEQFSADDFKHAQQHLWITSFLYGLLRPLDAIKAYRLEGKVSLPENGMIMFDFWKPRLTDLLIESAKADDGIVVDLASAEMRQLFRWQDVESQTRVIKPGFLVAKNGKVTMPSVWAKKCRGAMTAWILQDRLTDTARIKDFSYENFRFQGCDKGEGNPMFMKE